jgi:hypothetical protein
MGRSEQKLQAWGVLRNLAEAQHCPSPMEADERALILEQYCKPTVTYVQKSTQDEFAY